MQYVVKVQKTTQKGSLIVDKLWYYSSMAEKILTIAELTKRMQDIAHTYHLVDVRRDRESFYALYPEVLQNAPVDFHSTFSEEKFFCAGGFTLNLIMDGELEKSWEFIHSIPEEGKYLFMRLGLMLVHPKITWKEFIDIIEYLKALKSPLRSVVLTAGRPFLLNGFNDFTRISAFLEKKKDLFIEDLSYLYEKSLCPAIYRQCLAEYYYQIDKLLDAEVLVSRAIKEFDKDSERRLLFASLYLQTKILLAQGKSVDAGSYITYIRNFVKKAGEAEFSYNIDAAEVMTAIYEGNREIIAAWFKNNAPDEFGDFNMLDLYRYMVKMRCYIIYQKYTAVVALAEKLRSLLEAGKRHMDLCELDLILAINFWRAQEKELAFESLERALKIAKRRKYYRLIADEGDAVFPILIEYVKEKGESEFLLKIIDITRKVAINHPLYLRSIYKEQNFSQMETDILKLLEQGKMKEDIADYFFISVNTVKYHLKSIYAKLGVGTAHQAVWAARVIGVI